MSINDWLSEMPYKASLQILDDLGLRLAVEAGNEGAKLAGFIKSGDYQSLVDYEVDYGAGWDVLQLARVRQILGFYTKFEPLRLEVDKEHAAFVKFVKAEAMCGDTNRYFRALARGKISICPDVVAPLMGARRKIARILGVCPTVDMLPLRFGPGSTTSIKKRGASSQAKLAETPTCSDELYRSYLLPGLLRAIPHWLDCHQESTYVDEEGYEVARLPMTIATGKLAFVPKNAKTYRSMDVQPTLNTLLQCAIGDYMSDRLRMVGVNIRDQAPNQRAARVGSLDNSLSTIDLSSASDTISLELVRYLLPDEWFALLSAANCRTTTYARQTYRLEKFASMGNGFIFPLETLIFWALTTSACEGEASRVLTYGDDIVCPSSRYNDVVRILTMAGFAVNQAKSYREGAFRESCGADYYNGFDIRPYYQRTLVTGETLYTMHNFFFRNHDFEIADVVLGYIPHHMRLYGPDGYGDGHLLGEWQPIRSRQIRRNGWGGVLFHTFRRCSCEAVCIYPGDYVTPLYTIYRKGGRHATSQSVAPWTFRWLETLGVTFEWLKTYERSTPTKFLKSGRPVWPVPGSEGYEKVSIYTFSPV